PKLIDLLPPRLIALSHEVLAPREPEGGFASAATRRAITAAAVGLAFLGACTRPSESSEQPTRDSGSSEPVADPPSASRSSPIVLDICHAWPANLDELGLPIWGAWADLFGPWKSRTLP